METRMKKKVAKSSKNSDTTSDMTMPPDMTGRAKCTGRVCFPGREELLPLRHDRPCDSARAVSTCSENGDFCSEDTAIDMTVRICRHDRV